MTVIHIDGFLMFPNSHDFLKINRKISLDSGQIIYVKDKPFLSKYGKTLGIFIVAIFILLVLGNLGSKSQNNTSQTTNPSTTNPSTIQQSGSSPATINTFSTVKEGDLIRCYYLLDDSSGKNVASSGQVNFQVLDNYQNVLYTQTFNVAASQYVDYQIKLTGAYLGKAYEWRINYANINKSKAGSSYGDAVITFTLSNGKQLSSKSMMQIPYYTSDELKQMAEQEYQTSSTTINIKKSYGKFEVTVVRVGFFTEYSYSGITKYLRVDLNAKNIGSANEYLSASNVAILDSQNNQYDRTYGGTLDLYSSIYPGVTKSGYLLFEVPSNISSGKLVFQLGYDSQYKPYSYEYNLTWKLS